MFILDKIKSAAEHAAPSSIAIHSPQGNLSYQALWEESDRLAFWLEENLKDDKDPVVVYGHKHPLMIVCFLACVKSGRAYCPVDSSMPLERTKQIIEAVGNRLVFATEELDVPGYDMINAASIIEIIKAGPPIAKGHWVQGDDVFYIIFTSGSTGTPKGVQITCENLSRFTDWSVGFACKVPDENLVFLNQAPFSFDLSVMDLYTCLVSGGTLWCLSKELQADAGAMLEYLKEGQITTWVSTPSFADMCLADRSFCAELLPSMETFLFCGERLTKDTVKKLKQRFPAAKVINTYGPTESTVAVTGIEMTEEMLQAEEELPIGSAKPGTEIRLEDGEILILGDTVSPGYYQDPEKTEKAFILTENSAGQVVRGYRTGDAGYFQNEMLYYKGRLDLQIKLHGYRIELGDIEANLLNLPGIQRAAVIPKKAGDKIRHLVAFVVAEGLAGTFADGQRIRSSLREKLPDYMVPKKIIFVDHLPMTSNGKTDRRSLEDRLR